VDPPVKTLLTRKIPTAEVQRAPAACALHRLTVHDIEGQPGNVSRRASASARTSNHGKRTFTLSLVAKKWKRNKAWGTQPV